MGAMNIFSDYSEIAALPSKPCVVSIGNFDGVHLGHRSVLEAARKDADQLGLELAVLTFDPHPAELLNPSIRKFRLVEPERKAELLASCGVDIILTQRFDDTFASLSAEQFAHRVLKEALFAKLVFVGENFRFGCGREADVETLHKLGHSLGFEVRGERLIRDGIEKVSSSRIRRALLDGDVSGASRMLGRPHEIAGIVVHDKGEGRGIGFPTINLSDIHVLVPQLGIYAARCNIGDRVLDAAVNIGTRPTLDHGYAVEAHLLDFKGDLYNKRVVLSFVSKVRDECKFASVDALVKQIADDVSEIRSILGS
jgi:riboflavin kinase/FMN adenylyltransferase